MMKVSKDVYAEMQYLKRANENKGLLGALSELFDEDYPNDFYEVKRKIRKDAEFAKNIVSCIVGDIELEIEELLYYLKLKNKESDYTYVNIEETYEGTVYSIDSIAEDVDSKTQFTQKEIECDPFLNNPNFEWIPVEQEGK